MAKKAKGLLTQRQMALQRVLKAVRVERGINQRELSERLGRSHNYVTLLETGQRKCSVPEFVEFMDAVGADPQESMGRITRWKPE